MFKKGLVFVLGCFLLGNSVAVFAGTKDAVATRGHFTRDEIAAIEQIVKDYIAENPQAIVQSLNNMQKKQMEAASKATKVAIEAHKKDLLALKDSRNLIVGDKKSPIAVFEFFDYQCPHCKVLEKQMEALQDGNYDLQYIYVPWAIEGEESIYAAKAVLAAQNQGKALEFHRALLAVEVPLSKEITLGKAKEVGLDTDALEKDLKDDKDVSKQVLSNYKLGMTLKLFGTPTLIVANLKTKQVIYIDGDMSKDAVLENIEKLKN